MKRKKRGDEERFKIENENIRRSQLSRRDEGIINKKKRRQIESRWISCVCASEFFLSEKNDECCGEH